MKDHSECQCITPELLAAFQEISTATISTMLRSRFEILRHAMVGPVSLTPGLKAVGTAVTRRVGPLRSGTGLEFGYRDAMGATTNVPANVRQIVVTVRTGSGVLNSIGNEVADSLTTWVYTRN